MQNKLQYIAKTLTALLLTFVIHGFASPLYSQITLNDNRTKEILFTDKNDRETQSRMVVSLKNYSKMVSPGLNIAEREWVSNIENPQSDFYRYSNHSSGFVLPGGILINEVNETVENAFSIKNSSTENFGKLNISTDFIIKNAENSDEIKLVLKFRTSDGAWKEAGRGVFYPDSDQEDETFSIQLNISDVFVKQEEVLDLMWVNRSSEKDSHQLYTQRIEISAQYSDLYPYQEGGVLITEIMPMGNVDGFEFEYIELYNPDDVKKSLKGISIQTDIGVHTIQSDIDIPPYGFLLLSNADFSDLQNVKNSYFYSGNRLFSNANSNGRVEITQNGNVIASAVFESAEQNISFETKRMSQSVDGYSGLKNLTKSTTFLMPDVSGSPGINGAALPVYHRTFVEPGVYMITLPGRVYSNRVRLDGTSFYSLSGDPLQLSEIEPFEPVFLIKSGDDESTISVEGINSPENRTSRVYQTNTHRFISPIVPGSYHIPELLDHDTETLQTVAGVWNSTSKRVEMVNIDEANVGIWQPVIAELKNEEATKNRSLQHTPFNAENAFHFSLFEIKNDEEVSLDEVWVEIYEGNRVTINNENLSFFKKPLYRLSNIDGNNTGSNNTVLYGNYAGIDKSGLSYFTMHSENDRHSELSLGLFRMDPGKQKSAVLRWDIPVNIPDDWTVMLTDRETGQQIDMQLDESYTFRIQAQAEPTTSDNHTDRKHIQPVEITSVERDRFAIRFEPPNLSVNGDEDSETPGTIELRQNYPNPFNPTTNITFFLPEDRQVRLGIFNIVGQQVATLVEDNISAGEHSVVWNASNNPSGIYIVQLETGNRILTRKITLVK